MVAEFLKHPVSRYRSTRTRDHLRARLHSNLAIEPLGLAFCSEFRKKWMTAYTRLSANPASAVTAARPRLETVFKTIVSERDGTPDDSGNLQRLLNQAQEAVGFVRRNPANQSEHPILQGLTGVIGGVAVSATRRATGTALRKALRCKTSTLPSSA
jgi:hypothetical protein